MTSAEVRKLVDDISTYVNSADQTDDEQIATCARRYALACRGANDRLHRCAQLLEKGHRPEAISLAEAEPDLLELVSILNFAGLDEWQELAAGYGWDRFQSLKLDVAARISDAYGVQQQIEDLLRQHRRLALAQAPVKRRLATMREIARMDPTTPFWQDDIAAFERQRFGELQPIGEKAIRSQDLDSLRKFVKAYTGEDWFSPVPQNLEAIYKNACIALHTSETLPNLAERISAAVAHLDITRLGQLSQEWHDVISEIDQLGLQWHAPQHLQVQVQSAFQYLEQETANQQYAAYQHDIYQLQEAIRNGASSEKVDFLLAAAESHGYDLHPQIHAELAEFRSGATQAKIVGFAVIFALIMAGIAAIVFAFFMIREILD